MDNVGSYDPCKLQELFKVVDCGLLVVFEDEIVDKSLTSTIDEILYDIVKMDVHDRELLLVELDLSYAKLTALLRSFFEICEISKIGASWQEFIREDFVKDIQSHFQQSSKEINEICEQVDVNELQTACRDVMSRYGIAQLYSGGYSDLLNAWKKTDSMENARPLRIYPELDSARDKLESDIKEYSDAGIVFIVDDVLRGKSESHQIAKAIEEGISDECSGDIVGLFFSADVTEPIFREKIYFAHVGKGEPEKIAGALTKSAYAAYLRRLRAAQRSASDEAFKKALENPSIAAYLAGKSMDEGLSEHQVIADWIDAISQAILAKSHDLGKLKILARIINELNGNDDDGLATYDDLEQYAVHSAFDYFVNSRCEPIAPGDVFLDEAEGNTYYVLIGQECDLAKRANQNRKERIATLLKASAYPKRCSLKKMHAYDFETMIFDFFCREEGGDLELLSVSCGRAFYCQFEILDLSSFNLDGSCNIALTEKPDPDLMMRIPEFQGLYFEELRRHFESVKKMSDLENQSFLWSRDWIGSLEIKEEKAETTLRRVCRMNREYAAQLHRTHLAHKSRQGYGISDVSRWQKLRGAISLDSKKQDIAVDIFKPIRRSGNQSLRNEAWRIDKAELIEALESLEIDDISLESEVDKPEEGVVLCVPEGTLGTTGHAKILFKKQYRRNRVTLELNHDK